MLYSHWGVLVAVLGAAPAQLWSQVRKAARPVGMFPAVPQVSPWYGTGVIPSWGIESLVQSKSPILPSPKAIVLLVPSVISRTPRALACWPLLLVSARRSLPPNMKIPLGPGLATPTHMRLEPTD